MRKKIKQLMNKEEGFTLVELLAVIVILGIIVAIAIPSIGNVINNATTSANESEYSLIEDAARLYNVENEFTGAVTGVTNDHVEVQTLVDEGFLDLRESDLVITGKYVEKSLIDDTNTSSGFEYIYSGRP